LVSLLVEYLPKTTSFRSGVTKVDPCVADEVEQSSLTNNIITTIL